MSLSFPHLGSPPSFVFLFLLLFLPPSLSPYSGSVLDSFLLQQRNKLLLLDAADKLLKLGPKLQ